MGLFGGSSPAINATFTATDHATPVVKKLRGEISAFGSKTGGPLGGLISGLGGLSLASLGMVGAVGAAAGMLGEATKAAIDEQQSIDRLNVSLKDNVPNWQSQTTAIEETVKAGEALAFSADDQRNALALLVTRTHDVGEATKLMSESMDLARLKGISLADASAIIGKVFSGQVTAARRAGIAIDKTATSTQALAQIQTAAAGQAAKYADSTQGSLDKAAIAWHEAEVSIGEAFAPAIKSLADGLVTAIGLIGNLGDAFNNFRRALDPAFAVTQDMETAIRKQAAAMGLDTDAAVAFYEAQQKATAAQAANARATLDNAIIAEHAANPTESYAEIQDKLHTNIDEVSYALNVLQTTQKTSADATQYATNITQDAAGVVNTYAASIKNANNAGRSGLGHNPFGPMEHDLTEFESAWRGASVNIPSAIATMAADTHRAFRSMQQQDKKDLKALADDLAHDPRDAKKLLKWLPDAMQKAQADLLKAEQTGDAAGVAEAASLIARLDAQYAALRVPARITVAITGGGGRMAARAGGGPVQRDSTYVVGEYGPEVLHMGSGGGGYVTQGRGSGGNDHVCGDVYLDGEKVGRLMAPHVTREQGQGWAYAGSGRSRN